MQRKPNSAEQSKTRGPSMKFSRLLLSLCSLWLLGTSLAAQSQPKLDRQVAITIDDLPAGAAGFMTADEITSMTTKLLTTLRDQKVPAVGFVNEKKLYKTGEVDARIGALRLWVDYGFELGNHTYSHASLNRVSLQT